ncbi:MAG: S-layer homology domain-containing protein [Brevibacillus sp.]|nr:S-layer homology domain-containing protein [Brevibacillus sp.]
MKPIRYPWSKAFVHGSLAAALVFTMLPSSLAAETVVKREQTISETVAAGLTANGQIQEENISREQAIAIAKQITGSLDGYQGPEVSHRRWHRPDEPLVWELSWREEKEPYRHVQVVVDAGTGRILEYDNWGGDRADVGFPPKVSYEEAVKIGEEWLKKLSSHLTREYVLKERDERGYGTILRRPEDTYQVSFYAVINGVPFPGDHVYMSIDGNGELRSFTSSSPVVDSFADKSGVLDENEIRARLAEEIEMDLAYTNPLNPMPKEAQDAAEQAYVLSYVPTPTPYMIDAKTGKPIDYRGEPLKRGTGMDEPLGKETNAANQSVRSQAVTEKEALEILNQFYSIPEEVTIRGIEKEEAFYRGSGPVWVIGFGYEHRHGGVGWTGAVIEADTGRVIDFNMSTYLAEKYQERAEEEKAASEPSVSLEKAKEHALAFVKKQAKDKLHQLYWSASQGELIRSDYRPPYYRFSFERKVNGIRVLGDGIHVEVSAETGEIISYGQNWNNKATFPDVGEVADAAEVKQQYIDNAQLELEYYVPGEYEKVEKSEGPRSAVLVYRLSEPWSGSTYVDAISGKVIDRQTGQEAQRRTEEKEELASDIAGHPAEEALRHMIRLKALKVEDNKVNPEKVVSRGEFLDMMLRMNMHVPEDYTYWLYRFGNRPNTFRDVSKEHPYFGAVEWAVEEKLVDADEETFAPDSPITREAAAEILVTALGYEKLAEHDSLFRLPFADSERIERKGYAAIASEIGLINGADGQFRPDAALTRAEAAAILYRFIAKRAEYGTERKL